MLEAQSVRPPDQPNAPPSLAYELRESHELPQINCTTCLKDVLLRGAWLRRCNFLLHKLRRVIGLSLALGCLPMWACGFVAAPTGRWLGFLALIFQSGPLVATSVVLRYDMVCLLMRRYDFWFFTIVNFTTAVFGYLKYSDVRGAVPLLSFIGYQQMLLIDANHRGTKNAIVLSVVSGVMLMGYAVYVAFDMIDDATTIVVFQRRNWLVECSDIIVNGLSNIIVMLLRNAFRKHATMRKSRQHNNKRVVPCITYFCRTRLVAADAIRLDAVSTIASQVPTLAQLRLVHPNQLFCDDNAISSRVYRLFQSQRTRSLRLHRCYRLLIGVSSVLAIVAVVKPRLPLVRIAALVTSLLHWLGCVALYQRQLLRKLLGSFDFWFISVQISLMLWSICYLQRWDHRTFGMMCCWLWSHWVLMLDALTPSTKAALGIPTRLASLVLALLLLGQALLIVDLVFFERWHLEDRELFSVRVGSHTLHLRVASFLMSRHFSVFCWCCRLLSRLETRVEGELMLIQEALEYEETARQRSHERWKAIEVKMNAVAPLAKTHSSTKRMGMATEPLARSHD